MRLVVKQDSLIVNKFRFVKGPVNIGRQPDSQVFLPSRAVSRHHAVIFCTPDGKWMVEDLDSVNKTFLNNSPVHKEKIKTGDCLHIGEFIIEINLEKDTEADSKIHLEDTLVTASYHPGDTASASVFESQAVIRTIDSEYAPDIVLPAKRMQNFLQAAEAICRADSNEKMLTVLISTIVRQFNSYHIWCALRNQPDGPMTDYAGKKRDGTAVQLSQIQLNDRITEAMEKKQYLLFPKIQPEKGKEPIHSAIIAPIIGQVGCFGAIYIDNDMSHERYALSDLDYLILLSIHTAVVLENF